jgi:hypothetical protein
MCRYGIGRTSCGGGCIPGQMEMVPIYGVVEGWPRRGDVATATAIVVGVVIVVTFALALTLVVVTVVHVGVGGQGPVRELSRCCWGARARPCRRLRMKL